MTMCVCMHPNRWKRAPGAPDWRRQAAAPAPGTDVNGSAEELDISPDPGGPKGARMMSILNE
jgi:hypothetical protein